MLAPLLFYLNLAKTVVRPQEHWWCPPGSFRSVGRRLPRRMTCPTPWPHIIVWWYFECCWSDWDLNPQCPHKTDTGQRRNHEHVCLVYRQGLQPRPSAYQRSALNNWLRAPIPLLLLLLTFWSRNTMTSSSSSSASFSSWGECLFEGGGGVRRDCDCRGRFSFAPLAPPPLAPLVFHLWCCCWLVGWWRPTLRFASTRDWAERPADACGRKPSPSSAIFTTSSTIKHEEQAHHLSFYQITKDWEIRILPGIAGDVPFGGRIISRSFEGPL